jgi:hypothetical protein
MRRGIKFCEIFKLISLRERKRCLHPIFHSIIFINRKYCNYLLTHEYDLSYAYYAIMLYTRLIRPQRTKCIPRPG